MSRWLVITLSAILITSAIVIGVLVFLMKKMEKEEDEADKLYLQQKADLLQSAVSANLSDGSNVLRERSDELLKDAVATKNKVGKENSKLGDIISKQKKLLSSLRNKYSEAKKKIFSN